MCIAANMPATPLFLAHSNDQFLQIRFLIGLCSDNRDIMIISVYSFPTLCQYKRRVSEIGLSAYNARHTEPGRKRQTNRINRIENVSINHPNASV